MSAVPHIRVASAAAMVTTNTLHHRLCNNTLENFSSRCPPPSDSSPSESAEYDNAITALEGMLDTSLQNIHMRLLRTHSNKALAMYKAETASTQGGSLAGADAAAKADEYFVEKSEEASRPSGDWSCAAEVSIKSCPTNLPTAHHHSLTPPTPHLPPRKRPTDSARASKPISLTSRPRPES